VSERRQSCPVIVKYRLPSRVVVTLINVALSPAPNVGRSKFTGRSWWTCLHLTAGRALFTQLLTIVYSSPLLSRRRDAVDTRSLHEKCQCAVLYCIHCNLQNSNSRNWDYFIVRSKDFSYSHFAWSNAVNWLSRWIGPVWKLPFVPRFLGAEKTEVRGNVSKQLAQGCYPWQDGWRNQDPWAICHRMSPTLKLTRGVGHLRQHLRRKG